MPRLLALLFACQVDPKLYELATAQLYELATAQHAIDAEHE